MKVLITGGAGYIGSTIYSALEDNGHNPVILDSFINGDPEFVQGRNFYEGDIADAELLGQIINDHQDIEIVIHCAALIRVPESMEDPSRYYYNNVIKSIKFLEHLRLSSINKIIFSSTAAVYAGKDGSMVTEKSALSPQSPYSKTKLSVEMAIKDFCHAYNMY